MQNRFLQGKYRLSRRHPVLVTCDLMLLFMCVAITPYEPHYLPICNELHFFFSSIDYTMITYPMLYFCSINWRNKWQKPKWSSCHSEQIFAVFHESTSLQTNWRNKWQKPKRSGCHGKWFSWFFHESTSLQTSLIFQEYLLDSAFLCHLYSLQ